MKKFLPEMACTCLLALILVTCLSLLGGQKQVRIAPTFLGFVLTSPFLIKLKEKQPDWRELILTCLCLVSFCTLFALFFPQLTLSYIQVSALLLLALLAFIAWIKS